MKKLTLILIIFSAFHRLAYSGTYSDKGYVAPCPQWYGDNEWNVGLWGAYAFTGTEFAPNLDLIDLIQSTSEGHTVLGPLIGIWEAITPGVEARTSNTSLAVISASESKGLGSAPNAVDSTSTRVRLTESFSAKGPPIAAWSARSWGHLRCAILFRARVFRPMRGRGSARFSVVARATGLSPTEIGEPGGEGGGEGEIPFVNARTVHSGSRTELMGQFGGGLEFRFTRHIGWTNDFNWNVINGAHNDFGMFRTGINFAFLRTTSCWGTVLVGLFSGADG